MAIQFQQLMSLENEENTITLRSFGIETARQILIWLIEPGKWATLHEASDAGYISFDSSSDVNGGDVTIRFDPASNTRQYKVWDFVCRDIGETVRETDILHAVVGFSWQNSYEKKTRQETDVTWRDGDDLNKYAYQILHAIYPYGNYPWDEDTEPAEELYKLPAKDIEPVKQLFSFTEDNIGDEIKAEWFRNPVEVLRVIAWYYKKNKSGTSDELVYDSAFDALDTAFKHIGAGKELESGKIFNNISHAINYWRMKVYSVD